MYRDIATMDQGPGYLNGILSLILNTTAPAARFSEEEQRAIPYFHRSRAAELLALLDAKFPNSAERPELHAKLLEFYASSGESEAVIAGGTDFLTNFPHAPQRTSVALLMADAYARTGKTQEEFSIYDSVLQELALKAEKIPLGQSGDAESFAAMPIRQTSIARIRTTQDAERQLSTANGQTKHFRCAQRQLPDQFGARSPEYSRVLERYLARLVQLKQIPEALAVLRREIDRNPDDPGLYERLAVFLDQNKLGIEQEEIYRTGAGTVPRPLVVSTSWRASICAIRETRISRS